MVFILINLIYYKLRYKLQAAIIFLPTIQKLKCIVYIEKKTRQVFLASLYNNKINMFTQEYSQNLNILFK